MLIGDFPRTIHQASADACSSSPVVARDARDDGGLRQWVAGDADVTRQAHRKELVSQGGRSRLKAFRVKVGQVVLAKINRLLGRTTPKTNTAPQLQRESGVYDAPWDNALDSVLSRLRAPQSPGTHAVPQVIRENDLYDSGADISSPPALPERKVKTQPAVSDYDRVVQQSRPIVSRSDVPWYGFVSDVPRMPPSLARQEPARPLEPAYASVSIEEIRARNPDAGEEIGERTQLPSVSEGYARPSDSLEGFGPAERSAREAVLSDYAEPVRAKQRQVP